MSKSWKDLVLVALALFEAALVAHGTLTFGHYPLWVHVLLGAFLVFLNCTNYQCVAHNFIHTPFFSAKWLNFVFAHLNTLALGIPQTLYRIQHFHHHKYNNDAKGADGQTLDHSSTYRYGSNGREESLWTYALLGPLKTDVPYFVGQVLKQQRGASLLSETLLLIAAITCLGVLAPSGLLYFFLPVWYLGQAAALGENYMEHHLAVPGNRKTDSVSCYNAFYNWLWFNNGYHQEHHLRPQVHWTEIPSVRALLPDERQRRVVRGAHWFNFRWNGYVPEKARLIRLGQATHEVPSQQLVESNQ